LESENDAAHSVVLELLAAGGIPLATAYLAFLVAVGWAIVTGFRRLDGDRILLFSAIAGAWIAFQVQALVSIDVPPLAFTSWVIAGAVLALANPEAVREFRLPLGHAPRTGSSRRATSETAGVVGLILAVSLVVVGVWGLSVPLRADAAAQNAALSLANGNNEQAERFAERASAMMPSTSLYAFKVGEARARLQDLQGAGQAFDRAARINPRDFSAVITAARAAARLDELDRAEHWYKQAVTLEPHSAQLMDELTDFQQTYGIDQDG
jgi:tetratricopeptide (TPR) repeat protein